MSFVLDLIAKPAFILMSAALLSIFLHRSSAAMRHSIWILAIAGAMLVPLAVLVIPQVEWSVLPEAGTSVTFLRIEQRPVTLSPSASEINGALETTWLRLALVCALGATVVSLRLVMARKAVRRMTKTAVTTADDGWPKLMTELSSAFHVRRPVRLLFSERYISPMTWGVWRHTILLPCTAPEWSYERRRLVLAHELAHVKRNDGLLQIFVQLVCSVYWFNPLVWYAAYRVRIERERACDDRVLSLGTAAADYADHLVQLVRGFSAQRALSFASVSMAQPTQLESRLVSILDSGARRRTLSKTGTILVCVLAGLITASVAAIGIAAAVPFPPVLISAMEFAPPPVAPAAPAKPTAAPQRTRIGNGNTVPNNAVIPPQVLESSTPGYTQVVEANIEGRPLPKEDEPSRVGPGVTPPTVMYRVEPVYTDEARQAKYQGTIVARVTIHKDGTLTMDNVVRELDYGLTQKAIEALEQWKFKPAMKSGEPVSVSLTVEVNFNLK